MISQVAPLLGSAQNGHLFGAERVLRAMARKLEPRPGRRLPRRIGRSGIGVVKMESV
jgi:hypothetical protein